MSPRQPIEVQRGLVASLDRHDEGAGSVPTPRAERQSGRDRERQLLCPACGRATTHRFLYAKNGCDILQCRECGLGRTETASFDPSRYYTEDYFSGGHADGYAGLSREPSRCCAASSPARSISSAAIARADGCSTSAAPMASSCRRRSPSSRLPASSWRKMPPRMRRQSGLNVLAGVADESTLGQLGGMDVIVLLDVIEHLPSPRDTLALCARHLNPGGIIVITTGDFGSLYCQACRRALAADDAAAASVVLHAREHAADGGLARTCGRAFRPSLEDRSAVADRVPAPAHARAAWPRARRRRAESAYRSICSTPCASCCASPIPTPSPQS